MGKSCRGCQNWGCPDVSTSGIVFLFFLDLLFLISVGPELFIHCFWDYLLALQCLDVLVSLPDPFKYLDIIGKPISQDFLYDNSFLKMLFQYFMGF